MASVCLIFLFLCSCQSQFLPLKKSPEYQDSSKELEIIREKMQDLEARKQTSAKKR